MNKSDLAKAVADKTGLSRAQAGEAVDAAIEAVIPSEVGKPWDCVIDKLDAIRADIDPAMVKCNLFPDRRDWLTTWMSYPSVRPARAARVDKNSFEPRDGLRYLRPRLCTVTGA